MCLHWINNELSWKHFQFLAGKKSFPLQWGSRVARRTVITMLDLNLRAELSTPNLCPFPIKTDASLRSLLERTQHNLMAEFFIMAWLVLSLITLGPFHSCPQLTWTWFSYFILPIWWFLSRNKAERFFLVCWVIIKILVTFVQKIG